MKMMLSIEFLLSKKKIMFDTFPSCFEKSSFFLNINFDFVGKF